MIRVLHSVSNMDRAGIETMLMNYYRHVDRDRFQFDFIVNKRNPGDYDDEIRSMGGRIFQSPGLSPAKFPAYMAFMKETVQANPEIKILHGHNEAMAWYALHGAKKAGLKVRIAHAHNTEIIHDYKYPLKMVCKQLLPGDATHIFACGTAAGKYYFGKRWDSEGIIMPNAIDTAKFAFSEDTRRRLRMEYGLGDAFVLGNVGRFNLQKNHKRMIDIFASLLKVRSDAVLVLIGVGELQEEIKEKVKALGIQEKVKFLGLRTDVSDWYQVMDVFLMPSLFEGLPVVGVEAQTAGVPCVFSDCVTDEVVMLDSSRRVPLQASDEEWAKEILGAYELARENRSQAVSIIKEKGYDIDVAARWLEETYERI